MKILSQFPLSSLRLVTDSFILIYKNPTTKVAVTEITEPQIKGVTAELTFLECWGR